MTRATGVTRRTGHRLLPDAPVYDRQRRRGEDPPRRRRGLQPRADVHLHGEHAGLEGCGPDLPGEPRRRRIKLKLNQVDPARSTPSASRNATRQLFFVVYVTEPDPSWSTVWFICKQIDVWDWMYWCDKEYDASTSRR